MKLGLISALFPFPTRGLSPPRASRAARSIRSRSLPWTETTRGLPPCIKGLAIPARGPCAPRKHPDPRADRATVPPTANLIKSRRDSSPLSFFPTCGDSPFAFFGDLPLISLEPGNCPSDKASNHHQPEHIHIIVKGSGPVEHRQDG